MFSWLCVETSQYVCSEDIVQTPIAGFITSRYQQWGLLPAAPRDLVSCKNDPW